MVPDISRRSIIVGLVGTIGSGALGVSTYNWFRYSRLYSTRHHIQVRRLWGRNQSGEEISLDITAYDNDEQIYNRTYELKPSNGQGEDGQKAMNGPWVAYSGEYSIQIELNDEELYLSHEDIINELPGSCCEDHNAKIVVTVSEEKKLESEISLSD